MIASACAAALFTFGHDTRPSPRPRIAGLNGDVLGDRHPFDQPQILVDKGDRQPIRSGLGRPSVKHDVARVGFVDPGQHLYQRRLAGPVLAEQRVDLAAADVEVDMIERDRAGESLDEPAHHEQRRLAAVGADLLNTIHDRFYRRNGVATIPAGISRRGCL